MIAPTPTTYTHFILALCLAMLFVSFTTIAQQKRWVYDPLEDMYCMQDYDSVGEIRLKEAQHLYNKIDTLLSKNKDTIAALQIIDYLQKEYYNTCVLGITAITLGNILWNKNDTSNAIEKYMYGLNYDDSLRREKNREKKVRLIQEHENIWKNFNCCIRTADYLIKHDRPDSAQFFLKMARDLNACGSCSHSIIECNSMLAPFYADFYTAKGDTSKAIQILLDFLLLGYTWHPDTLARKLTSILQIHYTNKQIRKELKKGIRKIKFTDKDPTNEICNNTKYKIELNAFNTYIVLPISEDQPILKKWRYYFRHVRGIQCLLKSDW